MSQDLLKPERILEIDLLEAGHAIEAICEDFLKPPPKGIYTSTRLEPVMVDGQTYHYRNGIETVNITDISEVTHAVYDSKYRKVITATQMKNKKRYLSNEPFLPYHGIHIAAKIVQDMVRKYSAYQKRQRNPFTEMDNHFVDKTWFMTVDRNPYTNEPIVDDREDPETRFGLFFDRVMSVHRDMVFDFMKDKTWNIHHVFLNDTTLQIEQCMDFRAYCWELEHGEQWANGTYTAGSF